MKKVMVLDANQRSALAATRSLGKQNIPVFTADETPTSLAGASKFSKQHFIYPSPRLQPDQFIKSLIKQVNALHIDILLPMTELTTMLLLKHKAEFADTIIPFPDMDTIESLSNKCLLMKMADSLDIPIPRTWYANSPDDLPCEIKSLPFPVVLKPGKSWLFHEGQWRRASVRFANDSIEMEKILETDWAFKAHSFMIQETIAGHGEGVFAIYDNGKPQAFFAHRRLREKPPSGGVSVLSESTAVHPELLTASQKLLDSANWHGVAMVEFKVSTDGTPYLMEINTRFWGSLQLAVDAGVDFPYLLYQISSCSPPAVIENYRTGIKLRWLLGDLDNLYLTLRNKNLATGKKLAAITKFILPSSGKTYHEINRWSDLAPFWWELKQYIYDLKR